jgi:hypothetical protein
MKTRALFSTLFSWLSFVTVPLLANPNTPNPPFGNLPSVPWTNTMRPGIAAITCTSSGTNPAEHVLAMLDLRDPFGCAAPAIVSNASAWVLPGPRMFWPGTGPLEWSVANLGEIFGVDVGTGNTSNIYITAQGPKPCDWGNSFWANRNYTTGNNDTLGGGDVWQINGLTYGRKLIASLPNHRGFFSGTGSGGANCTINGNSFVGLGQVSYAQRYQVVYVSNLDDGLIYVISVAPANCGTILCTWNHGGQPSINIPDNPQQLYTGLNRMVYGLEYHPQSNRLFYALRNGVNQDEVWSIAVNAGGCPITGATSPCLELTNGPFPPFGSGSASNLPVDIQFSPDGLRLLVVHSSMTRFPGTVTSITPAGTYSPVQQILMRYAHNALPYEFTRLNHTPCGGWAMQGSYSTGNFYGNTNAVAGDYGYGDLFAPQALDSVVTVAEVIRPFSFSPFSYSFGLQIHPIADFTRASTLMNFDVPLLAGSGNAAATKIQLNDLDILHKPACMTVNILAGTVTCPQSPGGNGTVQITITNNLAFPVFGLSLTNCAPNPVPPGAVGITPVPVALPGGILNPGATTPPLTISLPGIPLNGGLVCFCVRLLNEAPNGVECEQMVCVNFPCIPPCMTLTTQGITCDPVTGGYSMQLCITNLQPQPVTEVHFSPCAQLPPGASPILPTVNPYILGTPLANGQTTWITLTFPPQPQDGGQFCFDVTLMGQGSLGGGGGQLVPLCRQKLCKIFPPCPRPCLKITTSQIECPPHEGAPYTISILMQNLSTQTMGSINIALCNPANVPPGCQSVLPSPSGYLPLTPPLLPNGTQLLTLTLPGLPCTGVKACFCITAFGLPTGGGTGGNPQEPGQPICFETACIQLPPCPCPPCMTITNAAVLCPTTVTGSYSTTIQITNLQAATATHYALLPCAPTNVQPVPAGVQPLPSPLATGQTSIPLPITLPAPLTGGTFCFCVTLLKDGLDPVFPPTILCTAKHCLTLPSCRCGEITVASATCLPSGTTLLTLNVTNFSNLYPSPYNFALATASPTLGFTPAVVAPSPNPITPGNSGTVTFNYNGPPGNTCVNVILSNANRTRCCPVRVCFQNPECLPFSIPIECRLRPVYICENGNAAVTFYVYNGSGSAIPFAWNIVPVSVPGCTSTLPPGVFSPNSGITPTIAPSSAAGVALTINTASVSPGTCAGFRICIRPANDPLAPFVCCTSTVKCPGFPDPCIVIHDRSAIITPGGTIGIPIDIKNVHDLAMTDEFILHDSTGTLRFSTRAPGDVSTDPFDPQPPGTIDGEHPLTVSLEPGKSTTITVFATLANVSGSAGGFIGIPIGDIGIGRRCVGGIRDDLMATGRVIFAADTSSTGLIPPPISQAMSAPRPIRIDGRPASGLTFQPALGLSYVVEANTDLLFVDPMRTYRIAPAGPGLVVEPDGSFTSTFGPLDMGIIHLPDLRREFYRTTYSHTAGPAAFVSGGR